MKKRVGSTTPLDTLRELKERETHWVDQIEMARAQVARLKQKQLEVVRGLTTSYATDLSNAVRANDLKRIYEVVSALFEAYELLPDGDVYGNVRLENLGALTSISDAATVSVPIAQAIIKAAQKHGQQDEIVPLILLSSVVHNGQSVFDYLWEKAPVELRPSKAELLENASRVGSAHVYQRVLEDGDNPFELVEDIVEIANNTYNNPVLRLLLRDSHGENGQFDSLLREPNQPIDVLELALNYPGARFTHGSYYRVMPTVLERVSEELGKVPPQSNRSAYLREYAMLLARNPSVMLYEWRLVEKMAPEIVQSYRQAFRDSMLPILNAIYMRERDIPSYERTPMEIRRALAMEAKFLELCTGSRKQVYMTVELDELARMLDIDTSRLSQKTAKVCTVIRQKLDDILGKRN